MHLGMMIADTTIDIGPNIRATLIALPGVIAAAYAILTKRQLQNNGGTTAFDKLEKQLTDLQTGQTNMIETLSEHGTKIAALEATHV